MANIAYFSSNNQSIHKESTDGFFYGVKRFIYSTLGLRNYSTDKILQILENQPKNSQNSIENATHINDIYLNKALKAGLDLEIAIPLLKIKEIGKKTLFHQEPELLNSTKKSLKSLQKLYASLPKDSPLKMTLNDLIKTLKVQSKWNNTDLNIVDKNGSPLTTKQKEQLFHKHFEDIKTLADSRLIFSIAGFQHTTKAGKESHALVFDGYNISMKINGETKPVSWIKENLVWDKEECVFATKDNKNERWNYFSPNGLVSIDRFYHHEDAKDSNYPVANEKLSTIENLSTDELEAVLTQGKKFHPAELADVVKNHKCVLQIVTNPRPVVSNTEFNHNLNKQIPVHCGIRLITEDGSVYSTGFGSTLEEDKFNGWFNHYFSSINGQPTNLDYEEFRTHDGRITTSISIDDEQSEKILNNLNLYRKESIRFNILRQNCMRLGQDCLSMAGVPVDITNTVASKFFNAFPSFTNMLGLRHLKNRVYKQAEKNSFLHITFKALEGLTTAISSPFILAANLTMNLLIFTLGAAYHSPNLKNKSHLKDTTLEDFDRLNPLKVLNPFGEEIFDSTKLIQWQLAQQSTLATEYKSGKPSMDIVPVEENTKLLAKMQDMFDVMV